MRMNRLEREMLEDMPPSEKRRCDGCGMVLTYSKTRCARCAQTNVRTAATQTGSARMRGATSAAVSTRLLQRSSNVRRGPVLHLSGHKTRPDAKLYPDSWQVEAWSDFYRLQGYVVEVTYE